MSDDIWDQPVTDFDDETSFWRDQRAEAEQYREQPDRRQWFDDTRAEANKVPCRDCKQPVGESCPLKKFPAHIHRITDARKRFG
jgi:hypothetical protein